MLAGLFLLIADIYAIVSLLKSKTTAQTKFLWSLLILMLPLLGLLLWIMEGPKN